MIEDGSPIRIENDGTNISFRNQADNADIPLKAGMVNSANLLSSITPTYTGWDTSPATNAQVTNELDYTLNTSGVQTNGAESSIKFDLGTSKRVIVELYRSSVGTSIGTSIQGSENDSDYYFIISTPGQSSSIRNITGIAKCRYLKYVFDATNPGNTISTVACRAYQI
jgi:hypothetical protein